MMKLVLYGDFNCPYSCLATAVERLGELDRVSQDLVIEIQRALEKHLWMLQAQLA